MAMAYWPERVERITGVPEADARRGGAPARRRAERDGADRARSRTAGAAASTTRWRTSTSRSPLGCAGKPFSGFGTHHRTGQRTGRPRARPEGRPAARLPPASTIPPPARTSPASGASPSGSCRAPASPPTNCSSRSARDGSARCSSWDSTRPSRRRTRSHVGERLRALDTLVVADFFLSETGAARRRRPAGGAVGRGRRHDDQPRGPRASAGAVRSLRRRRRAHRPRNPRAPRRRARASGRWFSSADAARRLRRAAAGHRRAARPTTRASPTSGSTPKTACSGRAPTPIIPARRGSLPIVSRRRADGRAFMRRPEADVADPRDADYPLLPHHRADSRSTTRPATQTRRVAELAARRAGADRGNASGDGAAGRRRRRQPDHAHHAARRRRASR